MTVFFQRRFSVAGLGLALFLLAPSVCSSDVVTLQNGGVLRGKVTKSAATVAVTTVQGTRLVFERSSVRTIERESSSAAAADKERLTDAQKAWFTKVRKLIRRIENGDENSSPRALRELRAINDPDALPALMQTLRTSDLDASRVLYVRILSDMPGSKGVVGLVEEALFDSSPLVRNTAQEATKNQRPEYVRPFYGQALRFPNRDVVNRAASVLTTVGDKENVPNLIDSLYTTTVDAVVRRSCCMSRVNYLAYPQGGRYLPPDNVIRFSNGTAVGYEDRLITKRVVHQVENPQVLEALQAITKQSFGYNTAEWRQWWKSTQLADRTIGR
jgi:hypothetical protein